MEGDFTRNGPWMVADLLFGQLRILDGHGQDALDSPWDIEVHLRDGRRFAATIATIEQLRALMDRYRSSGEGRSGLYLWIADLIIIDRLEPGAIADVIADLHRLGELEPAMLELEPPGD